MRQMVQGEREPIVQQVTDTALQFRLVTRYTSFVAVDNQVVAGDGKPMLVAQPVEMPQGVSYEGVFGAPPTAVSKSYEFDRVHQPGAVESFGTSVLGFLRPAAPPPGAPAAPMPPAGRATLDRASRAEGVDREASPGPPPGTDAPGILPLDGARAPHVETGEEKPRIDSDRKSTRLNSSHSRASRMPSSA